VDGQILAGVKRPRREAVTASVSQVRGDDPDLASYLRIEERELEAGERN